MIAVDLGQSGCRIWHDGKIYVSTRGKLAGLSSLEALDTNFRAHTITSEVVSLSLTGLYGDVGEVTPYLKLCQQHFKAKSVLVIDDGLANAAGALRNTAGVALTLGGGVVAVGSKDGRYSHADGAASVFGDEGGGYWLGSRGLMRALASRDGREFQGELEEIYRDEMALFDQLESKNGAEAVTLAISCAQKLLEGADSGIKQAQDIRNEGALRLAQTVVAAWRKVSTSDSGFGLTISGGLSRNSSYVKAIVSPINQLGFQSELLEAQGVEAYCPPESW